jgi:hypothetical protein
MQTAGARAREVLADAALDDDDVHPRERELGRQHQAGRTSSDNQNLMHHFVLRFVRSSVQ